MTPRNLQDYVKVYKDFVDEDLCKRTLISLQNIIWNKHSFYDVNSNTETTYDNDLSVSNEFFKEKNEITKKVWLSLEQYVLKDFSSFKWFRGWSGHSFPRFNKYDRSTEMRIHCDHIHTLFDGQVRGVPILTVLGALNNDYEGGEFVMFGDTEIEFPAGSVMVFPSNFMFPHEVRPVTAGTRYSYVSWAW